MAWLFTVVAGAPRLLALRHQVVEQRPQDGLAAEERGAARGDDGICGGRARLRPREVQGVDLERADEARVQALEVEHDDVRVEPGHATRARARPPAAPRPAPRARWGRPRRRRPSSERYRKSKAAIEPETRSGGRPVSWLRSTESATSRSRSRISRARRASVRLYSTSRARSSLKRRRISPALSSPASVLPSPSTERATASSP